MIKEKQHEPIPTEEKQKYLHRHFSSKVKPKEVISIKEKVFQRSR